MDEKKMPETQKQEKKLSRTTLTFYIIGLFSVAIALILISYVAQVRSDKQLENLNTKLSEQQTVAQGATQKMEDMQKQLDAQDVALNAVRESLATEEAQSNIASAAAHMMDEKNAATVLARAWQKLSEGDEQGAKTLYESLISTYGENRMLAKSADKPEENMSADVAASFEALGKKLAEPKQEEK